MPWEAMTGTGEVRWCSQCRKDVRDLSGLTESALHAFLDGANEGVCARLRVDADGVVITADRLVRPRRVALAVTVALAAACTPHVRPQPEDEMIAIVEAPPTELAEAPRPEIPAAPPRAEPPRAKESYALGGAIATRRSVPVKSSARTVPCEQVPGGEGADLLARCEP